MQYPNGFGLGTIVIITAAVLAFVGMQDNWRFAFFGIWYVSVYLVGLYAMVILVVNIEIEITYVLGVNILDKAFVLS